MMRVVAFGRTHWLLDSIRAVAKAGHHIVYIATATPEPEYTVGIGEFETLAHQLHADFHYFPKSRDLNHADFPSADVAISVNWPTLITQKVLDTFKHGVINAHMGDLPRYRGNAAPNWAILHGESHVGITLHVMNRDLDAGPILAKQMVPIHDATYIHDIYYAATRWIPRMFVEVLNGLERGTLTPTPQPTNVNPLRCYPRLPTDGAIDWRQPATQIHRLIRASSHPFAGAYTTLNGSKLTIWRGHREEAPYPCLAVPGHILERRRDSGEVVVATGDGWLVMEQVALDGQNGVAPATVITSLRTRLGDAA